MSRSVCYAARNEAGENAFLKAFDFREIERRGDIDELNKMSREYIHERDIHSLCSSDGISRVTRFFGAGTIEVEGVSIHYLLTEFADGTIRELHPPGNTAVPLSARFRFHRDIASALQQLHKADVAHQDLKPSNAVHLGGTQAKITDMGSASSPRLQAPPHDLEPYAGQPNYAPYELLYGETGAFYVRRIGCDVFLLGNLIFTDLVGTSLSHLMLHLLEPSLRHTQFTGSYADVMPDLISLHDEHLKDCLSLCCPEHLLQDVSGLIGGLCHPDPKRRGHPRNVLMNADQYGLERVISTLDRLATAAKLKGM